MLLCNHGSAVLCKGYFAAGLRCSQPCDGVSLTQTIVRCVCFRYAIPLWLTSWCCIAAAERRQVSLLGHTHGAARPAAVAASAVTFAPVTQLQGEVGGQTGLARLRLAGPAQQPTAASQAHTTLLEHGACRINDHQQHVRLAADVRCSIKRPRFTSVAGADATHPHTMLCGALLVCM
jgi:hypothetical protein